MLRLRFLVSAIPLIAAAAFVRVELFPGINPCLPIGADSLQIAAVPWHADLHVSFTENPSLATVRVAISGNAETADFAVVDDVDGLDDLACKETAATRFVAISARPFSSAPIIYLSHDEGASDYRIFVHSKRFTERDAAALVVGAHRESSPLAHSL
jgi:hypothetical protein